MRNPDRIPIILSKLNQAWQAAPDLRFGQLVENIHFLSKERADLFNVEDDKFEAALDKWISKQKLK